MTIRWSRPLTSILQLKADGECYFVMPTLAADLAQEVRAKQLYTHVGRDGNVALWSVHLPGDDGRLDQWSQSAHSAADMAKNSWVRLVANRNVGAQPRCTRLVYHSETKKPLNQSYPFGFKGLRHFWRRGRETLAIYRPLTKQNQQGFRESACI